MIEAIFLVAALLTELCPVNGAENQYNYFYSNAYEKTGTENNEKTASIKNVSKEQAQELASCLISSANSNNCAALYSLKLFYGTGLLPSIYGISKNQELSKIYNDKYAKFCSNKNA